MAVQALRAALDDNDSNELRQIFGPAFEKIANSDPVEATNELKLFAAAIEESNSLISA